MANKNKIGALVILGGIALLGYVYFKKTKPTTAKKQLEDLTKQADYYKNEGAKIETKIIEEKPLFDNISINLNPFLDQSFVKSMEEANNLRNENMFLYGKETNPNIPSQFSNLDLELQNLGTPNFKLSEQAIKELQNMNTGLGLDFSNLKF
jgi:hypothetical protein